MSNLKNQKSEYLLEKENRFVTKYGTTVNIDKPTVIYLRTKSKITPMVKQKEYDHNIQCVKDGFGLYITNMVKMRGEVDDNFLYNLDISEKSVKYGKVSFLRYDVYLKPTKEQTLIQHKATMERISKTLDERLEKLLLENQIKCV